MFYTTISVCDDTAPCMRYGMYMSRDASSSTVLTFKLQNSSGHRSTLTVLKEVRERIGDGCALLSPCNSVSLLGVN